MQIVTIDRSPIDECESFYRYRLSYTGHSSNKFGNCEVCNSHVSDSVKGFGGCGSFAWRDYLEENQIIDVGGRFVTMEHTELTKRWKTAANDDNALDGRTVKTSMQEVA